MKQEYASRKFIDLIQGVTSKWANWDPPRKIKVGDYGMIINETGEFDWEGNIYSTHFQEQVKSSKYKYDIDLKDPALQPIDQEAKDDHFIAKSWGVTATKANTSGEAAVPGAMTVALKLELQFASNKPEAVLVMHKPEYSSLPNDERIIRLIKSVPDILRGKYIVTEVISCAAYMMHMCNQKTEKFSVMLKATGPVAPGVDAGGTASFAWSSEAAYGISREGCDPTAKYMPLYRLKKPRPRFWEWPFGHRGNEIDNNMLNSWEDVDPPWNPLDEEGEECEIYDAVRSRFFIRTWLDPSLFNRRCMASLAFSLMVIPIPMMTTELCSFTNGITTTPIEFKCPKGICTQTSDIASERVSMR